MVLGESNFRGYYGDYQVSWIFRYYILYTDDIVALLLKIPINYIYFSYYIFFSTLFSSFSPKIYNLKPKSLLKNTKNRSPSLVQT